MRWGTADPINGIDELTEVLESAYRPPERDSEEDMNHNCPNQGLTGLSSDYLRICRSRRQSRLVSKMNRRIALSSILNGFEKTHPHDRRTYPWLPFAPFKNPRQNLPRIGLLHPGNLLGRALRDDAAAAFAAFGA